MDLTAALAQFVQNTPITTYAILTTDRNGNAISFSQGYEDRTIAQSLIATYEEHGDDSYLHHIVEQVTTKTNTIIPR